MMRINGLEWNSRRVNKIIGKTIFFGENADLIIFLFIHQSLTIDS